jgi:hypothetical protein
MSEISKKINVSNYDRDELLIILSEPYPYQAYTAKYEISMYLSELDKNKDNYGIKCTFSKNDGSILTIKTGNAFPKGQKSIDALIDKLEINLCNNSTFVKSEVVFSYLKINGAYSSKGFFQIIPPPENAPQTNQFGLNKPLIIQFPVFSSPNILIRQLRNNNKFEEIYLLLTVFLNFNLERVDTSARSHWVAIFDEKNPQPNIKYYQSCYTIDGFKPEQEEYDNINNYNDLEKRDHNDYYGLSVDPDSFFTLPLNIDELFEKYYSLPLNLQRNFKRSAYWYNHSRDTYSLSKSASYISLINSIETLSSKRLFEKKCKTCGKTPDDGPTKQFINFIERFSPNMANKASELYRSRSELTHGQSLFESDSSSSMFSFTSNKAKEWLDYRETRIGVQIALINWLLSN